MSRSIAAVTVQRQGIRITDHLNSLFERRSGFICFILVAIACLRIVSTYNKLSLTIDEPVHFACGLQYLTDHVYAYETQHPPLSRVAEALGPYLAGARSANLPDSDDEGYEVITRSGNMNRTIFLMRLGNLPFFALACLVVYHWASHAFGKPTAIWALAFFSLLPTMLADAGLAITDTALGATVGAAFLSAILWAENPTYLRSFQLGLFTGLALLSKFTALGYVPATMCLGLACYLVVNRPDRTALLNLAKRRVPMLALASVITVFVIWSGYLFHVGRVPLPMTHRVFRLPAPEFFDGIQSALRHNSNGHPAFLLGQFRSTGWWYYFPVALAVKTPLSFLALLAIGLIVSFRKRSKVPFLLPIAFCVAILALAMLGRIDIGIRHIEPIYIGLSILAALGFQEILGWASSNAKWLLVASALFLWMVVSTISYHPDYLSYFNEIAFMGPENILIDSNYDWGQDLVSLSTRLHQLGVKEFTLAMWPKRSRDLYLERIYRLPTIKRRNDFTPSPGWTVVSPTFDKCWRYVVYGPNQTPFWYDKIPATERVGVLRLYYVPE